MHGRMGPDGFNATPSRKVLPCHAAETITTLRFETVRDRSLAEIWAEGPAFAAYRGTDWMPDPCRSCDRRERDRGGCRRQAFAWNGDAATVDPACSTAPNNAEMRAAAVSDAQNSVDDFRYRAFS